MYELNCTGVIPGCERIIRAESESEVIRRARAQAQALGIQRISPQMMDRMRQETREMAN